MSAGMWARTFAVALFVGLTVYFGSKALGTPHVLPGVVVGVVLVTFTHSALERWFATETRPPGLPAPWADA